MYIMGYGIRLEAWGDYALFVRPEMKTERVSYDVPTPSAARGIIEAIYWKPAIKWVVDKIHVLNGIEFTNIRRNEVSEKLSANSLATALKNNAPFYLDAAQNRQQRAALVLKNVRYIIEAHFEMTAQKGETDTEEKHYNIALRRLRNGQFFHAPCFGCREFPARFKIIEAEDEMPKSSLTGSKDLGWMLYDMDFRDSGNITPIFFRAEMTDGIIDLTNLPILSIAR